MPRFETTDHISLDLELVVADLRIDAGDRNETVVEVRPSDESKRDDVNAAQRTRVEHLPGSVLVKTPRNWRVYSPFGYGGSVEVRIEVPAGSRVVAKLAMGSVRCSGTLGDSQIKTGVGEIQIERTGAARLTTGAGDIEVGHVAGEAELSTGSGEIRAGELFGPAVIKNANGDVVVGQAARGRVEARTGFGRIEIGIPDGTAAWLDLQTGYGQVRNDLNRSGPPAPDEESVEVSAHSGFGDITISRAYRGAT
jgi:DUF4097 and DUF4098 domain-containing protein YvlB